MTLKGEPCIDVENKNYNMVLAVSSALLILGNIMKVYNTFSGEECVT